MTKIENHCHCFPAFLTKFTHAFGVSDEYIFKGSALQAKVTSIYKNHCKLGSICCTNIFYLCPYGTCLNFLIKLFDDTLRTHAPPVGGVLHTTFRSL